MYPFNIFCKSVSQIVKSRCFKTNIMGINGRVRRMDSMMIESNIRKLSRMELLYTCISKLVILINKKDTSSIPEQLKHYQMFI